MSKLEKWIESYAVGYLSVLIPGVLILILLKLMLMAFLILCSIIGSHPHNGAM